MINVMMKVSNYFLPLRITAIFLTNFILINIKKNSRGKNQHGAEFSGV